MADPRYGTHSSLPLVELKGGAGSALILAGDALNARGPFETVQEVQMIDFRIETGASLDFRVNDGLDTAILYFYEEDGLISVNEKSDIHVGSVILLDANSNEHRSFNVKTKDNKAE